MKWFENITVNPKDVTDLKELIPLSILQDEDLNNYLSIKKVKDNDPVAFIGDGDDVGIAGAGCDPVYQEYGIFNSQKRWALGDWQIPLKICYETLQGTIAEYTLKTGAEIGDLTMTEFMTYILRPALERQIKRMFWRIGWFGDTGAKNIADGGTLKAGVNKLLFTTCEGIFKRIFAQGTTNPAQITAIAANLETTYKAQKTAILAKGVATDLFDNMLMDADARITADPNAKVYMTKAMADALTYDTKKVYNTIMPWETVFEGVNTTKLGGVEIVSVGIWDQMIKAYENTGAAYNKPYRMVYGNYNNFQIGTADGNLLADLDIWFDQKERRNYIYSTGKMGTQIAEDDMFHAAY